MIKNNKKMKIVIAPDSFKGNMRSPEVCDIIKKGFNNVLDNVEIITIPMADGGEGTTDAVVSATNGTYKTLTVNNPLNKKISAKFAIINKNQCIMEMASASGIELISNSELNPMKTSTYGTGEMICSAINMGIKDIIIGIGGSATVDGGVGMAQALGYKFLDKNEKPLGLGGEILTEIKYIDSSNVHSELKNIKIRVASDVTNPLTGPNGAAKIFGPQKGANPNMVDKLESGLSNLGNILKKNNFVKEINKPGDGAAGGLGLGLRAFCNAQILSGANLIIEVTQLEKHLQEADLLITGEGCTDGQTLNGKLCAVIAEIAKKNRVPVILLSGALKGDLQSLHNIFDAVFSISSGQGSLEKCIAESKQDLYFMSQNIGKIIN